MTTETSKWHHEMDEGAGVKTAASPLSSLLYQTSRIIHELSKKRKMKGKWIKGAIKSLVPRGKQWVPKKGGRLRRAGLKKQQRKKE